MQTVKTILISLFAGVFLAACAGSPARDLTLEEKLAKRSYKIGAPVERIQNYTLNGWNHVDREHLIIISGAARYYLVSLNNSCYNLVTAEDIAITSTAGQLTRFDHLLVPGYSNFLQRCYISSLHELNKAEAGVNLTGL